MGLLRNGSLRETREMLDLAVLWNPTVLVPCVLVGFLALECVVILANDASRTAIDQLHLAVTRGLQPAVAQELQSLPLTICSTSQHCEPLPRKTTD